MRRLLLIILASALCVAAFSQQTPALQEQQTGSKGSGEVYVKGYYTKSGKYVKSHYRKHPDTRQQHHFKKRGMKSPLGKSSFSKRSGFSKHKSLR